MVEIKKRRGISPVIATVLLIAIVVILAIIVFLWARGFIKESIEKKGENVDQVCNKVNLEATYLTDTGELQITNIGNVPVYSFNVRTKTGGTTKNLPQTASLAIGQSTIITLNAESYDKVEIFPIVLGQTKSNKKVAYTCKNSYVAQQE